MLVDAQRLDYADSYTVSGGRCEQGQQHLSSEDPDSADSGYCGVYTRVPANCTSRSPAGRFCAVLFNADPTLCDGAPVYQMGGARGNVLFRSDRYWLVTRPEAPLSSCWVGDGNHINSQQGAIEGDVPTAPSYGGYTENNHQFDIIVTATDAGGAPSPPSPPPPPVLPSPPSPPPPPVLYPYLGCFADDPDHDSATPDDLSGIPYEVVQTGGGVPTDQYGSWRVQYPSTALADCARICSGYSYMGLQWAWQCFCGDSYGAFGPASGCGEQGQNCGNGVEDGNSCSYMNAVFALTEAGGGDGAPSPPPGGGDGGKGR